MEKETTTKNKNENGQKFNKSILNKYKIVSAGNYLNMAQNIFIEENDTGIPKNLPTFIVASKNGGKSTLISSLISACKQNEIYSRIIYIYSDHVDSTLAETCHELLIRVSLGHSVQFITQYFQIKTEYMSWIKFIDYNVQAKNINLESGPAVGLNDLLKTYTDNIVDNYVRNYLNIREDAQTLQKENKAPEIKIYEHAKEFIKKYSREFKITIDGLVYHISGLGFDQFDQLIIDDVSAAADLLFPTTVRKSPLYPFLTVSRHILLGTIIAGQDIQQIPKYARKEINTYMFGIGLDITGIQLTNIPKNKQKEIIKAYQNIEQYEFVQYNGIENTVKNFIF